MATNNIKIYKNPCSFYIFMFWKILQNLLNFSTPKGYIFKFKHVAVNSQLQLWLLVRPQPKGVSLELTPCQLTHHLKKFRGLRVE